MKPAWSAWALLGVLIAFPGCGSSQLAEYQFDGSTVAVVVNEPATPQVRTGGWTWLDPGNVLASAARAGAAIAKEVSAERAEDRMMRAMERVDVGSRIAARTLERSAMYLRATAVASEEPVDYVLDIWIHDYGIHADSWNSEVYFRMKADVILLDGATGARIWKQRVRAKDPITAPRFIDTMVDDVLTAGALSRLTEDEMVAAFEHLADVTADHFTRELRDDLRKARERRGAR